MLVALVNHSLCWRLVYTSGAALITSLVSRGTQPQLTRAHNFKHFPGQAFRISKVAGFPKSSFWHFFSTQAHLCPKCQALRISKIKVFSFPNIQLLALTIPSSSVTTISSISSFLCPYLSLFFHFLFRGINLGLAFLISNASQ